MASQHHTFNCNASDMGVVAGGSIVAVRAMGGLEIAVICEAHRHLRIWTGQSYFSRCPDEFRNDGMESFELFACCVGLVIHSRFRIFRHSALAATRGLVLSGAG